MTKMSQLHHIMEAELTSRSPLFNLIYVQSQRLQIIVLKSMSSKSFRCVQDLSRPRCQQFASLLSAKTRETRWERSWPTRLLRLPTWSKKLIAVREVHQFATVASRVETRLMVGHQVMLARLWKTSPYMVTIDLTENEEIWLICVDCERRLYS